MKTIQPPTTANKPRALYFGLVLLLLTLAGNISRVNAQCRTTFFGFPDSSGYSIQFFDSSSGGTAVSYAWDFGDGGTSNLQSPSHTYTSTGYYLVCLTVTFNPACTATFCDSVYAGPQIVPCTANFNYNSSGGVVNFTDQSSGGSAAISTWSWDFGDGGTSSVQNPTHIYSNTGTYYVCLSITTTGGMCANTTCTYVQVQTGQFCIAGFGFNNITGQLNAVFSDSSYTSSGTITSWFWDFGDSTTSTLQNPNHTFPGFGVYQVCLTITSSTGCTDTYCYTVDIRSPFCTADFYASTGNPLQMIFVDNSSSSNTITGWAWDFGDGGSSSLANPTHTYSTAGVYNICLTISTSSGCSDTYCDSIYVGNTTSCQASFTAQITGADVYFQDNSIPYNHIGTWDFGDGNITTSYPGQSVMHQYTVPGMYLVCLSITDSMCTSSVCDTVVVTQSGCSAQFTSITDSINFQTVYFFDQSSGNASTWLWDFGDGGTSNVQNPVYTYAAPGTYRVCLTITDSAAQCTNTYCNNVMALSPCAPSFGAYPDSLNQTGVNMNFWVQSNCGNPSAIFWDFGDGTYDSTGVLNPVHQYADTGTYNVCVCIVIGIDTICNCEPVYAYRLINGIRELNSPVRSMTAAPNPFRENTQIRFDIYQQAEVDLSVVDLLGNIVETVYKGSVQSGDHAYTVGSGQLSPGIYFVRLDVNGFVKTQKIFFLP